MAGSQCWDHVGAQQRVLAHGMGADSHKPLPTDARITSLERYRKASKCVLCKSNTICGQTIWESSTLLEMGGKVTLSGLASGLEKFQCFRPDYRVISGLEIVTDRKSRKITIQSIVARTSAVDKKESV